MKKKLTKKAMSLGDLYNAIFMLILIGMVLGLGLAVLGKFSQASGIGNKAEAAINNTIDAIAEIPATWLEIIVIVIVLVLVIGLLIRSFGTMGATR